MPRTYPHDRANHSKLTWHPGQRPIFSGAASASPDAHRAACPSPRPHPTPRNIALAPLRTSPRGPCQPRLAKRSIAPPRPTACVHPHWPLAKGGGAFSDGTQAGRARAPEPRPLALRWSPDLRRLKRAGGVRGKGRGTVALGYSARAPREGCW